MVFFLVSLRQALRANLRNLLVGNGLITDVYLNYCILSLKNSRVLLRVTLSRGHAQLLIQQEQQTVRTMP